MAGKLIIFSAPSGSGKSTIINYLLKQDLHLRFSISATSRAPRGTEKNGVEYYFLTPEEFRSRIANGDFLEYEEVYTDKYYGTLKSEVERILNEGDNYFFVDDMIEKPKKGQEFSNYSILGRVLLTPEIYEILAHTKPGAGGEIQLTDAMAEYARTRGGMTAVEFTGKHYDMGNKLKVVEAQVELALQHPEIGEEFRAYLKEFCKTL